MSGHENTQERGDRAEDPNEEEVEAAAEKAQRDQHAITTAVAATVTTF